MITPTLKSTLLNTLLLLTSASLNSFAATPPTPSPSTTINFAADIQPILADNCYTCHGPDASQRKAKLRFDTQAGALAPRKNNPAINPGDPAASALIARINNTSDDIMPPPDSNRTLTPKQKQLLHDWIEQGATWSQHWAFAAPTTPAIPNLKSNSTQTKLHPIDAFIRHRLQLENLTPNPAADRRTLIRRVTLDLLGLPPTPAQINAFLADKKPNAYVRLVDRLLDSPHFGERFAWPWLDAARYADTNGYQQDPTRTMWPWRDWAVSAINTNLPFNEFTIQQLAGDLLPNPTQQNKIASGFNRNHMHNGEGGRIPEETRVENVFDRTETTATTFLALTFTCARCHDHKFDPISQADYYSLYAFFNQTSENGKIKSGQIPPILDVTTPDQHKKLEALKLKRNNTADAVLAFENKLFPRPKGQPITDSPQLKTVTPSLHAFLKNNPRNRNISQHIRIVGFFKEQAQSKPEFKPYAAALKKLQQHTSTYNDYAASMPRVMIMDTLKEPRTTQILNKGAYNKPTGDPIQSALPHALHNLPQSHSNPTLNRLDLANWITSPSNPLTARVIVNRYWQSIFGAGLVTTPEDFGLQGAKPSHPQLLDYLATRFTKTNWNVKQLIRFILLSKTYKQSATATPELLSRDPQNILLARSPRYRLPSWMLRDQALAISGLLVPTIGGPPVKPYQPPGLWDEATFGKIKYTADTGAKLYRRTLYTFWRRIVGPTILFDTAKRQTCTVSRTLTNTPLHALITLNETGYVEAARNLAQRVMLHAPSTKKRIDYAFLLATARPPSPLELQTLTKRLNILTQQFTDNPSDASDLLQVGDSKRNTALPEIPHAAYTALCSLILNLDETLTRP